MVAPLLSEEEGQEVLQLFSRKPTAADLIARLWDEGEMTWRRARSLLGMISWPKRWRQPVSSYGVVLTSQ